MGRNRKSANAIPTVEQVERQKKLLFVGNSPDGIPRETLRYWCRRCPHMRQGKIASRTLEAVTRDGVPRQCVFLDLGEYKQAAQSFLSRGRGNGRYRKKNADLTSEQVAIKWAPHRRLLDDEGTWVLGREACDTLVVCYGTLQAWRESCPYLDGQGLRCQFKMVLGQRVAYYLLKQIKYVGELKAAVRVEPSSERITVPQACAMLGLKARNSAAFPVIRNLIPDFDEIKSREIVKGETPGHRYRPTTIPRARVLKLREEFAPAFIEKGLLPVSYALRRLNCPRPRLTLTGLIYLCEHVLGADRLDVRDKHGILRSMYVLTGQDMTDIRRAFALATGPKSARVMGPKKVARELRVIVAARSTAKPEPPKDRSSSDSKGDGTHPEPEPSANPTSAVADQSDRLFIPNEFQLDILEALNGKIRTATQLQRDVSCDRKNLYRQGLNPLKEAGRVRNIRGRNGGYCRPDALPSRYAEIFGKTA